MRRNTRTDSTRTNDDRQRMNDGMKLHGSRAHDDDRELRKGRANDDDRQPRKSNGRFTGSKRGH